MTMPIHRHRLAAGGQSVAVPRATPRMFLGVPDGLDRAPRMRAARAAADGHGRVLSPQSSVLSLQGEGTHHGIACTARYVPARARAPVPVSVACAKRGMNVPPALHTTSPITVPLTVVPPCVPVITVVEDGSSHRATPAVELNRAASARNVVNVAVQPPKSCFGGQGRKNLWGENFARNFLRF